VHSKPDFCQKQISYGRIIRRVRGSEECEDDEDDEDEDCVK
jgi:hypothetical protein